MAEALQKEGREGGDKPGVRKGNGDNNVQARKCGLLFFFRRGRGRGRGILVMKRVIMKM